MESIACASGMQIACLSFETERHPPLEKEVAVAGIPLRRKPLVQFRLIRLRDLALAALLTFASVGASHAAMLFTATLTNDQEVPPVVSPVNRDAAYGSAVLELNDAQNALSFTAQIFNIDISGTQTSSTGDNLLAAHIHFAPAGVNGPVVWGFVGAPFNDNSPMDLVVTPFADAVGGTISGKWDALEGNATTLTAQLPNLLAGHLYLNFHTQSFPGGEIRGQILQVPVPGSLALFGLGLGLAACLARRARSSAI